MITLTAQTCILSMIDIITILSSVARFSLPTVTAQVTPSRTRKEAGKSASNMFRRHRNRPSDSSLHLHHQRVTLIA